MVHDKHAMNAAGESDVSLFRVVDASDVEATVLRNAEKRVRDSDIPPFIVSRGLGFSSASLGRFCADTDSLILRIVADAARHEGRQLRESGVANLAARDRVSTLFVSPLLLGSPTQDTRRNFQMVSLLITACVWGRVWNKQLARDKAFSITVLLCAMFCRLKENHHTLLGKLQ